MGFVSSLRGIVDRSPGHKHPLRLHCNLASDFPSRGEEVLCWGGQTQLSCLGRRRRRRPRHGSPDEVFLARGDQQETQNQCNAGLPAAGTSSPRCLPVPEDTRVPWQRPVSQDHPSSRSLRRSCCTTGLRGQLRQPLALALTPRTVPSGWGSALCDLLLAGGQAHPEP